MKKLRKGSVIVNLFSSGVADEGDRDSIDRITAQFLLTPVILLYN
jgi:hypothetical protein